MRKSRSAQPDCRHRARRRTRRPARSCRRASRSTRSPISTSVEVRAYVTEPQLAAGAPRPPAQVTVDVGGGRASRSPGTVSWISSEAEFTPTPIQTRDERADLVYAVKIRVANSGRPAEDRHAGRRAVRRRDRRAVTHGARTHRQTTAAVVVEGVVKRFGQTIALDDVSFSVHAGELFGFIGPDGGGKTTLFRILATLLVPDAGRARVLGEDVVRGSVDAAAAHRLHARPLLALSRSERRGEPAVLRVGLRHDRRARTRQIAPIYRQLEPFKDRARRRAVGRHEAEAGAVLRARPPAGDPVARRADDRRRRRLAP